MVRRSGSLVALVLAALLAGAWLYWRSSDRRADAMRVEKAAQHKTTAMSSEQPRVLDVADIASAKGADEDVVAGPTDRSNSQVGQTPSSVRPAGENQNSSADLQPSPSDMDGLSVPEGAVFPIAESIEKECASNKDLYFGCSEVQRVLKKIEDEGRDMQWAPSMESRIRAVVGAMPGVRLRALACRSTVCAVEIDGELVTAKGWDPLDGDLIQGYYVRAYEPRESGGVVFRVKLFTFERRR